MSRTPREQESRVNEARVVYQPPSKLPDPTPEPGYVYHWVATRVLEQATPTNVSEKMRDGWVPVKAEDHPELYLEGDKNGNVEIGGLMLCKMNKERYDARKQYYEKVTAAQMSSVDNSMMGQQDPRMPMFAERKTTVTRGAGFGSGSK